MSDTKPPLVRLAEACDPDRLRDARATLERATGHAWPWLGDLADLADEVRPALVAAIEAPATVEVPADKFEALKNAVDDLLAAEDFLGFEDNPPEPWEDAAWRKADASLRIAGDALVAAVARERAATQAAPERRCVWMESGDDDKSHWETDCGETHVFIDGTPSDNAHDFCPYCGKPIIEALEGDDAQ